MDIRIDGLHERAFVRLMKRNGEKTIAGMTRILIRDAAINAGLWGEEDDNSEASPRSEDLPAQETSERELA